LTSPRPRHHWTGETATSNQKIRRRIEEPLGEVYRRLVGIHASAAEATNADPHIRGWVVNQLMDVLHYIESVEQEPSTP
jgi:hypothetical protein